MRRCSVPGCRSNFRKPYVSVFSFPKKPEVTKSWLKSIGCPNLKVHENIGVCIKHFKKHMIIGIGNGDRKKVSLKHGSIPTIINPPEEVEADVSHSESPEKSPCPKKKAMPKSLAVRKRSPSKGDAPKKSPFKARKTNSSSNPWPSATSSEPEDEAETSDNITIDDDDDVSVIEEPSKPKTTSNDFIIPSPYKNLPSVSVCLKEEDRVKVTQVTFSRELKGIKRSPSINSNSSTGSNDHSQPSASVKRRKVEKVPPTVLGRDNDVFCWVCHRENVVLNCIACPRAFHFKCAGETASTSSDWVCPVCESILAAENMDSRSSTLAELSLEKLNALLKLSFQRFKSRAPIQFHAPVPLSTYPKYLHYVIHPMDLSVIEKNLKQNVYGCTEAFLADVKWMAHNSCVFNGNQHSLSSYAKSMVKTCDHDMQEIEICPDCFVHNVVRNKHWFSEVCRNPHPVVWAKLKGFPYWPAKVVRIVSDQVDARFFGAHDRAWVPVSQCYHLSKEMPTSSKPKKKSNYEVALDELNMHVQLLLEKFKCFEYAPYRTAFDPTNKRLLYHGIDIDKIGKEEITIDTNSPAKTRFPSPEKENRFTSFNETDSEKADDDKHNKSLFDEESKKSDSDESITMSFQVKEKSSTAGENVLKPIENGKEVPLKEPSVPEPKKDCESSASRNDSEPLSDSDQLRKLELALERIKGYVSLNVSAGKDESKDSRSEQQESRTEGPDKEKVSRDGTREESDKNSSPTLVIDMEASCSKASPSLKKPSNGPEVETDDVPAGAENVNASLESSKKTDLFFLKLNETIQSCKAKLGISEINDDVPDNDSNIENDDEDESDEEDDENSESGEEAMEESADSDDELTLSEGEQKTRAGPKDKNSEGDENEVIKDIDSSEAEESSDSEAEDASSSEYSGTDEAAPDKIHKSKPRTKSNSDSKVKIGTKDDESKSLAGDVRKPDDCLSKKGIGSSDVLTERVENENSESMDLFDASPKDAESSDKSPEEALPANNVNDNLLEGKNGESVVENRVSGLSEKNDKADDSGEKDCMPAFNIHEQDAFNTDDIPDITSVACANYKVRSSNFESIGAEDDSDDDVIPCNSPPPRPKTPPVIILDDEDEESAHGCEPNKALKSSLPSYSNDLNAKDSVDEPLMNNSLFRKRVVIQRSILEKSQEAKRKLDFGDDDDVLEVEPERIKLTGAIRTFRRNVAPTSSEACSPALKTPKKEVVDEDMVEKENSATVEASIETAAPSGGQESDGSPDSSAAPKNLARSPIDLRNLSSKDREIFILKSKLSSLAKAYHIHTWKWNQEREELRHNMNLILMEMRASLEADKKQAVEALSKKFEMEKDKNLEEIKRKQWCATCLNESRYACCWNTSYCSSECQKKHFPQHKKVCVQVNKRSEALEIKQITGLKTSDKSEGKKLIVLNMKPDSSKPALETSVGNNSQLIAPKPSQIQIVNTKGALQTSMQPVSSSAPIFLIAPVKSSTDAKKSSIVTTVNSINQPSTTAAAAKKSIMVTASTTKFQKILPCPLLPASPSMSTTLSTVSVLSPTGLISTPAPQPTLTSPTPVVSTVVSSAPVPVDTSEEDFNHVIALIKKNIVLTESKLNELKSKLIELGVKTKDDLKFVILEDLTGILTCIEYRKLMAAIKVPEVVSKTVSPSITLPRPRILSCTSQNSAFSKQLPQPLGLNQKAHVISFKKSQTPQENNSKKVLLYYTKQSDNSSSPNLTNPVQAATSSNESCVASTQAVENSETKLSSTVSCSNLCESSPNLVLPNESEGSVVPTQALEDKDEASASKTGLKSNLNSSNPPVVESVTSSTNSSQSDTANVGSSILKKSVSKKEAPKIEAPCTSNKLAEQGKPSPLLDTEDHNSGELELVLNSDLLSSSDVKTEVSTTPNPEKSKNLDVKSQYAWANNFHIPWTTLPSKTIETLRKGLVPNKVQVKQIVKMVSQEIYSITSFPDNDLLKIIVQKMSADYPNAFNDSKMNLMLRIKCWIQYRRKAASRLNSDSPAATPPPAEQAAQDNFGCAYWQPPMIFGETDVSQEKHKGYLKDEFQKQNWCNPEVRRRMMLTFPSQRKFINFNSSGILDVKQEWPFLFEEEYLLTHFDRLMGFDASQCMLNRLDDWGFRIYRFFKTHPLKNEQMRKVLDDVKFLARRDQVLSSIFLLMIYFKENEEILIQTHEDSLSSDDVVKCKDIPSTPFIITLGGTLYTAKTFALVIDKAVVSHFQSAVIALVALFASFYVFNIKYPKACTLTLVFIQRYIADIKPKSSQESDKEVLDPKIQKLNQKLTAYASEEINK